MSKQTLKLFLWLILSLGAMGIVWVAIAGLSNILAYFQQGADPATALNILPNAPPDLFLKLEWLPDAPNSGRVLDAYNRQQVEIAYEWAWAQWNISYLRKAPYGIATYFTEPALKAVRQSITDAAKQGLQINQVNTSHQLRVNFYSADGNLLSLTDEAADISSIIRDASGTVIFAGDTRATYDMILLQQEGRWQIRDFVRRQAKSTDNTKPILPLVSASSAQISQTQLVLDGKPFEIAGINYYPQATPWDNFWVKYDPQIIDQDFALIKTLGMNSVRIFVNFEDFGGPQIKPDMLDNLEDLLKTAENHDLKVIVTLFDFRTSYDPLLWPQSDRHLDGLIPKFADNPAILAWDIKNEPDLDYGANTATIVNAWLAHTARYLRELAPKQPITIGWSSAKAAQQLVNLVDIVSFHDYLPPASLPDRLSGLVSAAMNKPILLEEYGLPTWNSIFPNGHTDAEQTEYYADTLNIVRSQNLLGAMAWTLYDFNAVPASVAGRWPWQTGPQSNLGIVRRDGVPKPAAALLAPDAVLKAPTIPAYARFLKPFWLLVFASGIGIPLLGLIIFIRRRIKRHKRPA